MVNAIRCPTSNMHATMRRFDCTARCWLPLMQVDRSLCMTTMCDRHVIHNLCVLPENCQGNSQELHVAVVGHGSKNCRFSRFRRDCLSRTVEALSDGKPEMAAQRMRWKCGGMRNRLSKTTSKVRSRASRADSICDLLVALEHVPQFAERIGARRSRGVLPHRAVDSRNHVDRLVETRITSRLISAHQAKVARVLVSGDHGAQLAHQFALFGVPDVMGEARDRGQNVDGRIARLVGDVPESTMCPSSVLRMVSAIGSL